jgi:inorganic pyrophosphatase
MCDCAYPRLPDGRAWEGQDGGLRRPVHYRANLARHAREFSRRFIFLRETPEANRRAPWPIGYNGRQLPTSGFAPERRARFASSAPHAAPRACSRRFFPSQQRAPMSFANVPAGKDLPQDFNVIIEIPAQSDPVKYEADKEMGLLVVDRFVGTGMRYPVNYGFIPQTLSGDGDPVDVLVITPFPLLAGSVVRSRALGMLQMTDESGVDAKLIAVAHDKVCPMTANIKSLDDVPEYLKDQIKHFFENYKSLEKGKWVKVEGWAGIEAAHKEISEGVANFKK